MSSGLSRPRAFFFGSRQSATKRRVGMQLRQLFPKPTERACETSPLATPRHAPHLRVLTVAHIDHLLHTQPNNIQCRESVHVFVFDLICTLCHSKEVTHFRGTQQYGTERIFISLKENLQPGDEAFEFSRQSDNQNYFTSISGTPYPSPPSHLAALTPLILLQVSPAS